MNIKNKRGLSPVIATVLLVALVLVLAVIVFLWARSSITEQIEKFGKPVERNCEDVDFTAVYSIGLLDVANNGNIPIHEFEVKQFKDGDSEIERLEKPLNEGRVKSISFSPNSGVDKVIVYPVLLGKVRGTNQNKKYVCLDNGITINL